MWNSLDWPQPASNSLRRGLAVFLSSLLPIIVLVHFGNFFLSPENTPSKWKFQCKAGAVVVAQLAEHLLQIPEVHSLNPVIGKI